MKLRWIVALSCLQLFLALPQIAFSTTGITDLVVRRDEVTGRINLGDGAFIGEFVLSFEQAFGLVPGSLDISAEIVDPRDPELLSRLPENVFLPQRFPVVLKIEPNGQTPFSFRGRWSLEIRTPQLEFSSHSPLRLFQAPTGGTFEDVSFTMGLGSYRVRALGAAFSEFIIVSDLRTIDQVVDLKFSRLLALIEANAEQIPNPILTEIISRLEEIEDTFERDQLQLALRQLDAFLFFIIQNSGDENIPDFTDPAEGTVGLGATLRAQAASTRFSVDLLRQQAVIGLAGITRTIELEDGSSFDLELSFADTVDIDFEKIQISAELIDPSKTDLTARLPDGVQVPEEFPVLLRITPDPSIDQAFCGTWSLEIHTEALDFLADTPLRLFKAPDGGAFEDITRTIGLGSYRVRALGAAFSEFVIAADLRPVEDIVTTKLEQLFATLETYRDQIPPLLLQQLEGVLDQFVLDLDAGDLDEALADLTAFQQLVKENEGRAIPGFWRSVDNRVNVAGLLRALAETLRFSTELQQTPLASEPGDVNRDGKTNFSDILALFQLLSGGS